ncbi:MAG: Na/Pi cotransporter family protein [Prolixibacteraceae bacterium]|jgi:phosphate:Na+ symporter|nr:Na/Pi cotransporter family protein [Prolixibacteraceae bacterium]
MGGILLLLSIAGAIALFLFGMKLMSESLQKIMSERIRKVLSSMTSNKFKGILTGVFITALIQSSSATTVMVVSFVNAGILQLVEAISLIIGANIGTTLTAWLISFFGFELNSAIYMLPLIGISIPFLFSNKRKLKNWGEILLGFSLLFISLNFLKDSIPQANMDSGLANAVQTVYSWGHISYLIFLLIGVLFTIIIKSSSSIFALTLVLAFNGWINFELAAAMVLGENIGTTLTAISASKVANITAKRAAIAHLFFNLTGVIWVIIILPFFLGSISNLYMYLGGGNPFTNNHEIPLALALFHTLFNVLNTIILIGFTKQITQFVIKRVPSDYNAENRFKLTHIKIGVLSTPDASLYQARRETVLFTEKVRKMFMNVERIYDTQIEKDFKLLSEKIKTTEEYANRLETEIANFLTKVGEGRLSETSSKRMRALFKMIDDIESIADSCINILSAIEKKRNSKFIFPDQINNNVHLMFNMVRESLDIMVTMLTHDEELPLSMALETENEINNFRDILKSEHLNNLEKGVYKYDAGILYNDIISQCERIGDYAINVDEAFKSLF